MARIFSWKSGSLLWHQAFTRCGRISASSRISPTVDGLMALTSWLRPRPRRAPLASMCCVPRRRPGGLAGRGHDLVPLQCGDHSRPTGTGSVLQAFEARAFESLQPLRDAGPRCPELAGDRRDGLTRRGQHHHAGAPPAASLTTLPAQCLLERFAFAGREPKTHAGDIGSWGRELYRNFACAALVSPGRSIGSVCHGRVVPLQLIRVEHTGAIPHEVTTNEPVVFPRHVHEMVDTPRFQPDCIKATFGRHLDTEVELRLGASVDKREAASRSVAVADP